jgi:hypothetical protein
MCSKYVPAAATYKSLVGSFVPSSGLSHDYKVCRFSETDACQDNNGYLCVNRGLIPRQAAAGVFQGRSPRSGGGFYFQLSMKRRRKLNNRPWAPTRFENIDFAASSNIE